MEGPRGLKAGELPSVATLANVVFRQGSPYRMEDEYPLLFSTQNLDNMRVFVDGGRVISLVGMLVRDVVIMGSRARAACIGSVSTYPEYRNRGLATRLMEDATAKALAEGASLMLISGGRGLYRRLGCVDAGLYKSYLITKNQLETLGEAPTLRKWENDDIVELMRLHQMEPIRFVRPYEDFRALLAANRLCDRVSQTYIIVQENYIVAYVCLQLPEGRGKPLVIEELAGSRIAILRALRDLMADIGTETAIIESPSADIDLGYLMRAVRAEESDRGFMGTVKVIDVMQFLKDIDAYITETIGRERRKELVMSYDPYKSELSFEYMGERFGISGIDKITAFLFGSVEMGQQAQPESPALRVLLSMIFPMPLVDYGLNYA